MALKTVAIVGGGIGGLNLAQALRHYNPSLAVTVYEQVESACHKPQGWHLGINEWGLESMRAAQVQELESVIARNMVTGFVVSDQHLNEVLRIGGPQGFTKMSTAIIHRADLHKLLENG